MNNILVYNGYRAVIEFSTEDMALFGKVLDIDDKVIFEIDTPDEAESIFHEVIDDYLEFCKENNKEPCRPYKGAFNVRISPELHKKAAQMSRDKGMSLNSFVETAIRNEINNRDPA